MVLSYLTEVSKQTRLLLCALTCIPAVFSNLIDLFDQIFPRIIFAQELSRALNPGSIGSLQLHYWCVHLKVPDNVPLARFISHLGNKINLLSIYIVWNIIDWVELFLQGGAGQRSQSSSMQQKTQGSKSSYGTSAYWANWGMLPTPLLPQKAVCACERVCVKLNKKIANRKTHYPHNEQPWAPLPCSPHPHRSS